MKHLTMEELDARLDTIRRSPSDGGVLEMIVRRPATEERSVLEEGELDLAEGLKGETGVLRGINAKVVTPGVLRVGDVATKV